jgi:hypothetical protein
MSKLGKQFQLVVADVVRQMDPNANVREGQWVKGPDGARELDVVVEGTIEGVVRRIQIECRDYGMRRRRIGIGAIDALESKHRDLKIDASLMCSNIGFSDDAVRKAKRVGIGLIGVLRQHDPRIRYRVFDEFYTRVIPGVPVGDIRIVSAGVAQQLTGVKFEDFAYGGIPVSKWLSHRVGLYLYTNLVVNGSHPLTFRFKRPVDLEIPSGTVSATSISMDFKIAGWWLAKRTEINAPNGLYDWIQRAVRLGVGVGTISVKDVPFGDPKSGHPVPGMKWIRCPPNLDDMISGTVTNGGVRISPLVLWVKLEHPDPAPELTALVVDEDLVPFRRDIPRDRYYSQRLTRK